MKDIIEIKKIEGLKMLYIPIFLGLFHFLLILTNSNPDAPIGYKLFFITLFYVMITISFIVTFDLETIKINVYKIKVKARTTPSKDG